MDKAMDKTTEVKIIANAIKENLLQCQLRPDVWRKFAIWLLIDSTHGVIKFTEPFSDQYNAIKLVASLLKYNCQEKDIWKWVTRIVNADNLSVLDVSNNTEWMILVMGIVRYIAANEIIFEDEKKVINWNTIVDYSGWARKSAIGMQRTLVFYQTMQDKLNELLKGTI